ncbi:hypothetical protein SPRG_19710 [Saprolegnia parasitica CBS 223.65]|uniref:Uncharacterized protein n=1 Tax=Saprolegnia parasitica (strain CBS 223.65) TaxID=695850 RepID=A0A067CGE7_SAPPC|nr:hypothetical protein SPRG_19710 [Saprolegnia parasitica CBS 223.65]KDO29824.1 hypothetical protein SPRG_19710 [Saprolegnia parasitica CBS 223.65]|eukprot:XP_012199530.1 hypothetical protein SPRG_19710 [Saprolegnia parasitica CBS 223.65]
MRVGSVVRGCQCLALHARLLRPVLEHNKIVVRRWVRWSRVAASFGWVGQLGRRPRSSHASKRFCRDEMQWKPGYRTLLLICLTVNARPMRALSSAARHSAASFFCMFFVSSDLYRS